MSKQIFRSLFCGCNNFVIEKKKELYVGVKLSILIYKVSLRIYSQDIIRIGTNMQKTIKERKIFLKILTIIVMISIAVGYCSVEPPEKVYYPYYSQYMDKLENVIYDKKKNEYTIVGDSAAITFDMGMKVKPIKYLYLDLHTSLEQPTNWTIGYINSKGEMVYTQNVILQEGSNEIQLINNTLWQLKMIPDIASGVTFTLKNVELRNEGKDFLVKKFLLFTVAAFITLTFCIWLWLKNGPVQKSKDLLCEMKQNIDNFLNVLAETISWKFSKKQKRMLRSLLFIIILGYVTYIEYRGVDDLVSYFSMHMWVVGGILLILTGLTYENHNQTEKDSVLHSTLLIYLAWIWISDFYLNKKFRYAGFGMVFFGGYFLRAWRSMEEPEELMEDFKRSYKVYFFIAILFCLIFRPIMPGVHYNGIFTNTVSFGIMMLTALVIFVNDYLSSSIGLWNGIGAATALFYIWKTQKITIVFLAGLVIIAGAVFWFWSWFKGVQNKKNSMFLNCVVTTGVCIVCVFVLERVAGVLPYKLGMQKEFVADIIETYEITLSEALKQGSWKTEFYDKIQVCKTYLQYTNFWGNKNLTKYFGETVWPANSIVMNMFRYGMVGGIAYVMMLAAYLATAIKAGIQKKNFLGMMLAIVGITVAMTETIERPFTNIGWYIFYICMLKNSEN